jgi:hypothetical protein
MAGAQNKIFSINAAADLLGKDRRTLDRALVGIPPDGYQGKLPRWRLATIVQALEQHQGTSSGNGTNTLLDEIEHLGEELEQGFTRAEAEPDLVRRREIMREVGPLVGRIDVAMRRANARRPKSEQALLDRYCSFVIGRAIGNVLFLGGWDLKDEDAAA